MERKTEELVVVDLSPFDALFQLLSESPSRPSALRWAFYDITFRTAVLMDPPQQLVDQYDSLEEVGCYVGRIRSVISSLDLKEVDKIVLLNRLYEIDEDLPDSVKVSGRTSELSDLNARQEIRSSRPDPSRFGFPRTNQLGFIDHLVKNLDNLMKAKANSIGILKYCILQLRQSLHSLSCDLVEIPELQEEEAELKDLIQKITDLAYQAEYLVDQFLIRDIPMWYCLQDLNTITVQLDTECGLLQTSVVVSSSSNRERGRELMEVDMAPLDALFKLVHDHQSHFTTPSHLEEVLYMFASYIALMKDESETRGADNFCKKLAIFLGPIGSIMSSLDLKEIDHHDLLYRIAPLLSRIPVSFYNLQLEQREVEYDSISSLSSQFKFTAADCLLNYLYHVVKEINRVNKAASMGPLKYYMWRLQQKLRFLCFALEEMPESSKREEDIGRLAIESEYIIVSVLTRGWPSWSCLHYLYKKILPRLENEVIQFKVISGDTQNVVSRIIDMQITECNIIPIVNNTEIKLSEIFNHPDVIRQFEIRSRSLVASYEGRKKEVFLQLLRNASYENKSVGFEEENMTENELGISIRNLFTGRTFFIILEELQDINALNDIVRVLPRDLHSSRVLLTTPSLELAIQCRQNDFFNKTVEDHASTSESKRPTIDDDGVIGFEAETERMLELLTEGTEALCIISIVGMGGQGKTTLAKKLYRDPSVVYHFDVRSQCCVTQVHRKKELLLELLSEVGQHHDSIHTKNDEELAELLYKNLKGLRFLIILDDIWKIDAWNDLSRCFPDDKNGSRIMFITRIQELAFQAKSNSIIQHLSPLSDDESWELLRSKVFHKESCPPELMQIGRQIAEDCKGLPLSIALIGGLLAKEEKKVDVWKGIAKTLTSQVQASGQATIELSYKHLSNSLKSCFLYLGVFVEDREILVQKLVRLWIAEGFIKSTNLTSLEDVAMDYLRDLVRRSLITIAQERSIGGVKSCRVHDLLREFCLTKAKEENFFIRINGYDEHFSSSNDNLDYGIDPNYSCSSTSITYDLYRLSIYSKRNHFLMLKPSRPFTRSLLFFARSDMCPDYSYDMSFIFYNFKFLNILDLEEINIGDSFKRIDVLVLLRYLAVQSDVDFIPSSIANLWNLETFLFKGSSTKVVKISDSIWDMNNLRHMHVHGCVSFDLEPHQPEKSSTLNNLQTFSTPTLTYGDNMMTISRRLPSIQKLKCIFLDSWNDAKDCNHFPELEFLNQLVSLKVLYNGKGLYPCKFSFPSNLKKLSLSKFRMPWSEISQLAFLCNLEVLKLLDNAFEGETWMLGAEVFPKLKFLKLKTLNVKKWEMEDEVFPCLEHLSLHECGHLEEIPPIIGEINTLQKIDVVRCDSSLATSVEEIRASQLEYGKKIKVHIHPMPRDSGSSS